MIAAGKLVSTWGEGPIWHDGKLYYVDIEGHLVVRYDPSTDEETTWDVGQRVGTVVPRASGGLVIAGDRGFFFLETESGELTPIVDPESDLPENRFNDGKCDPAGRFWAGTMHLEKPRRATGALYRLDGDLAVHKILDEVTVSNGIIWNRAADTMYYIDTPRLAIEAFDYENDSGEVSNRRTVVHTSGLDGVPDGMAIDENDHLWVAMCHGGLVLCFDPTGAEPDKPLHRLEAPVPEVTAVAFGGKNLADLYVTTGRPGNGGGDFDGRLFVAHPGVRGMPSVAFVG